MEDVVAFYDTLKNKKKSKRLYLFIKAFRDSFALRKPAISPMARRTTRQQYQTMVLRFAGIGGPEGAAVGGGPPQAGGAGPVETCRDLERFL